MIGVTGGLWGVYFRKRGSCASRLAFKTREFVSLSRKDGIFPINYTRATEWKSQNGVTLP